MRIPSAPTPKCLSQALLARAGKSTPSTSTGSKTRKSLPQPAIFVKGMERILPDCRSVAEGKYRWDQTCPPVYFPGEERARKISSSQAGGVGRSRHLRRGTLCWWCGWGRPVAYPLHRGAGGYALGDSDRADRALGRPEAESRGHPRGERSLGVRDLPWHGPEGTSERLNVTTRLRGILQGSSQDRGGCGRPRRSVSGRRGRTPKEDRLLRWGDSRKVGRRRRLGRDPRLTGE